MTAVVTTRHAALSAILAGTGSGTIRTAAFTLTRNANGTDTLTLGNSQVLDPAALQQALAQHGIPALVKTDTSCWSNPALPGPASIGVLTVERPDGTPVPSGPHPVSIDHDVTVINPAAMPAGTELFFGYFNSGASTPSNPASSTTAPTPAATGDLSESV